MLAVTMAFPAERSDTFRLRRLPGLVPQPGPREAEAREAETPGGGVRGRVLGVVSAPSPSREGSIARLI